MSQVEETNGGGKALCIQHGERLTKVEEAILDISQSIKRVEAKIDKTPESLRDLIASEDWSKTGAATRSTCTARII